MKSPIFKFRKEKNLTQKELAEISGLSQSYINEIENNKAVPSRDAILKLSEVLEICPYSLLNFCKNCSSFKKCEMNIFL